MAITRFGTHINAPRATVYGLLLDGDAVGTWLAPAGMTSRVHRFDAEVGGTFSITLADNADAPPDKPTPAHYAYYGRFLELVPDEQVVEVLEFVTEKPEMSGAQTITFTLTDDDGGTRLDALHEGVPPGLTEELNDEGWRAALTKLVALAERGTVD
ncbi:SRPBCC domain-containing protein [Nocardia sp. NPDC058176]|uniref:SRPBCC domain-containing protein n=1 Tax=Nocardia sp. NPDC058176 TaxID=3346368 RepID=UPI0036D8E1EF